jgi:hypothetical protein
MVSISHLQVTLLKFVVHVIGNYIIPSFYISGHFLTCWDLTPDLSSSGTSFSDLKSGNIRIELRFKAAISHAIIMLLRFYWDAELLMTHDRKILTDF